MANLFRTLYAKFDQNEPICRRCDKNISAYFFWDTLYTHGGGGAILSVENRTCDRVVASSTPLAKFFLHASVIKQYHLVQA